MPPSLQPDPLTPPVPRSLAPWTVKAESYVLFLKGKELGKGVYDPTEAAWADEETYGKFVGGIGAVMVVRYSETPVGPYDEIMLIPGAFTLPQPTTTSTTNPPNFKIPKSALRISRIYVSQRTTTYNGRLNWNIPKHLARFTFSSPPTVTTSGSPTAPPAALTVCVYPPTSKEGDGTAPFFAATLKPWKWVPALSVDTKWLPGKISAVQPPIPGSSSPATHTQAGIDPYDLSASEKELIVGTERWCEFEVKAKTKRVRGCWVEVLETGSGGDGNGEEVEEGRWWPRGLKAWGVGGWMEESVMDILEPVEWKV